MWEMKLGKNIVKLRHEAGITQDQLAEYMGVSKSSISKWETGYSYPDILLLPQLAALFNISVDELMGYEPQLTKEAIRKLYRELAEEMAKNPKEAKKHCDELVKKYYSCFLFLNQIIVLYMNHCMLFEDPKLLLDEAVCLCERIEQESRDPKMIKEIVSMKATALLMAGRPQDVLELLGEEPGNYLQDTELIGAAFQSMGDGERAEEVFQVCMYQHLISFIQDSLSCLVLHQGQKGTAEETIQRVLRVIDTYHIDELHLNTALLSYLTFASAYVCNGENEKAVDMLEKYSEVALKSNVEEYVLHGDSYFTKIDRWIENLYLGAGAPRNKSLVKASFAEAIETNPAFAGLLDHFRVKSCLEKLKRM